MQILTCKCIKYYWCLYNGSYFGQVKLCNMTEVIEATSTTLEIYKQLSLSIVIAQQLL